MPDSTNYMNAMREYRDMLRYALKIAEDGFKAPEMNIEIARERLMPAMWKVQVEFAALELAHKREKAESKPVIENA